MTRRAHRVGECYFLKGIGGINALIRANMAQSVYELAYARKCYHPGNALPPSITWAPLTESLLTYYLMHPLNPERRHETLD